MNSNVKLVITFQTLQSQRAIIKTVNLVPLELVKIINAKKKQNQQVFIL